jgi:RNA polymerase sigma factor (sigma-70 family)
MPDANDMDLLREFARHNSETAFAELVHRHLNLVYSVALRFTASPGNAEDVAQAVFIILARKAARLNERTVLTGWLYETTRLTAAGWLRSQKRRQAHEQEAFMQSTLDQPGTDEVWRQLAPHLEAGMSRLAERDRTLLALRFYENKTGAEAAALMGIREEAAHKRTARALEKLRKFFTKRGVSSTTAILAGTISANSVQAAPAGLAAKITAAAILSSAAIHSAALIAATKTIAMTTLQKSFITITIVATVGVGIYEARQATTLRHQVQTLQQQQAPLAEQIQQLQRERNDATNRLTDMADELAKANGNNLELLKLRGEVGMLRQQTNSLRKLMQENQKLLTQLSAQPDSTNQVSAEDRFILRQTHIVDAMNILLNAVKTYAASHNGEYPISFEQLTAAGFFETSSFAGDVGLDDFEFVKEGTLDPQGNKVILGIRVPLQRTGKPSVMITGGITGDGVTHTEIGNVSSE